MEAVQTSEALVKSYLSTRRYNPEDRHLQELFTSDETNVQALRNVFDVAALTTPFAPCKWLLTFYQDLLCYDILYMVSSVTDGPNASGF
jgi:hypothetical protein